MAIVKEVIRYVESVGLYTFVRMHWNTLRGWNGSIYNFDEISSLRN